MGILEAKHAKDPIKRVCFLKQLVLYLLCYGDCKQMICNICMSISFPLSGSFRYKVLAQQYKSMYPTLEIDVEGELLRLKVPEVQYILLHGCAMLTFSEVFKE